MTRALVLVVLTLPTLAAADQTHRAELRVAHIERALQALQTTPADVLERANDYAHVLGRGACASSARRLQVECLMTAARAHCRGNQSGLDPQRCAAIMDVVLSNLLGDAQLVPIEKRYQIMTRYKDYRRELGRELRRIQGALAVDFRLRSGATDDDATMARDIDQYCLATTDENNVPWQTCVSSLVWFIGTEARSAE